MVILFYLNSIVILFYLTEKTSFCSSFPPPPPIPKVFEEGCGEKTFFKKFLPAINLLSQIPLKREKWNKLFYF